MDGLALGLGIFVWVLFLHLTVRDLYLSGNRRGRATTSGSADFEGRESAAERRMENGERGKSWGGRDGRSESSKHRNRGLYLVISQWPSGGRCRNIHKMDTMFLLKITHCYDACKLPPLSLLRG